MITASKPIKRSEELKPLSRDHHEGLLLCWKIRSGLNKGVEEKRIKQYVLYVFQHELEEHFRQEEELVFDLLPNDNARKTEALLQHDALRAMIKSMSEKPTDLKHLLGWFADQLDDHIRFEERKLFPYIEQNAEATSFKQTGIKIKELHSPHTQLVWEDEFWTIKS